MRFGIAPNRRSVEAPRSKLRLESSDKLFFQPEQPIKRPCPAQHGRKIERHWRLQIIQMKESINTCFEDGQFPVYP
jgi:hypothetical protein